jgi:hypothetical protein
MHGKLGWAIFWALIAAFVVVIGVMVTPVGRGPLASITVMIVAGAVIFGLGVALIVLTVKEKVGGRLKRFLLLTGASAVGIPVSSVLHNVIYALFILWQGEGFWDRTGLGDEPFFFFMAVFVCPIGFLVGAVGRIVLAVRERRQPSQT